MLLSKLLDMKNDYVFKRIFGHIGNEEITAGLLSSILDRNVSNLKLDNNPILEKDLLDDKVGILDIKAKIDNNINCDIEMQVLDQKDIEKRLLYYWSKMYEKSITSGKDYIELEKSIAILIIILISAIITVIITIMDTVIVMVGIHKTRISALHNSRSFSSFSKESLFGLTMYKVELEQKLISCLLELL